MTYLKLQRKGDEETNAAYINTGKITKIKPVRETEWKGEERTKRVVGTRIYLQDGEFVRVEMKKPQERLSLRVSKSEYEVFKERVLSDE